MFKKMFGLLIVGLMLACGALSGVSAAPLPSKFQDTFDFNFTIGKTYSLNSIQGRVLVMALNEDKSLVCWGNFSDDNKEFKLNRSYGFKMYDSLIDVSSIFKNNINKDFPDKFEAKAHKPYNKSSVIEVPYWNETDCIGVNTTVNINTILP
jgi:hypothetical protein